MKYTIILLSGILVASCGYAESPDKYSKEQHQENAVEPIATASPSSEAKKDKQAYYEESDGASTLALDPSGNSLAPDENLISDRKLIWNANLEFQVKDIDESSETVRGLCKRHKAYISDMEREDKSYELSNYITIRVSNEHFQDLVAAIKGESKKLDIAQITSQDVTEEFVDIENRLETKRKARERYIEILRSKTGTIDEVIQAEEAIRRITEEIEAKEGRLRYLSDQMEFSTISLRMYKPIEDTKPQLAKVKTYGDKVQASFGAGWNVIKALGLLLIAIWPLLLILTGVAIWKRKWIRRVFGAAFSK